MITILSPAKKLSTESQTINGHFTQCDFLDRAKELVTLLQEFDPPKLQSFMGISEKLAEQNWERFQSWRLPFDPNSARESIFSFMGDAYLGLDAKSLSKEDITYAQDNLRILSGLYGVLRPLDLMLPYRLEMGSKLKSNHGKNLYQFWGNQITEAFNAQLDIHNQKVIINCASVEYFKAINSDLLKADVITPVFKEIKNGTPKMMSFYAKRARGMMARFIIQNRLDRVEDIQGFNQEGYTYDASLSTPFEPVFTRPSA